MGKNDLNNNDDYKYNYGYLICYLPFKTKIKKSNKRKYDSVYQLNNEFKLTTRAILRDVKSSINKHVYFYHLYTVEQKKMMITLVCDGDAGELCSKIVEEGEKHHYEIDCKAYSVDDEEMDKRIKDSDLVLVSPQIKNVTEDLLVKYPDKKIVDISKKDYRKMDAENVMKMFLTEGRTKTTYIKKVNKIEKSTMDEYIDKINKIFFDHHKEEMEDDGTEINIKDISFSIYDEKNYKNIGILKVIISIRFNPEYTDEKKGQALSHLYDVISRNTKNKFDNDDVNRFKIFNNPDNEGSLYADLVSLFNGMPVKMPNRSRFVKYYKLEMNEDDWAFNYADKDRKCYTFAYYTVNDEINEYCKAHSEDKIKESMYKIARIHENGAIRTYNKNNDIFDLYQDDTSVIWGVSRVGLGAILIQKKRNERDRNIKVLNEDFAFIYEFCLHQKFFSFSLINHNRYSDVESTRNIFMKLKTWLEKISINQYLLRKAEFTSFNEIFCPQIVSEFETQDVYDLVRKKIEVNRLMDDAKNTLNALEAEKSRQISARNTFISAILSTVVFPLTISSYIDKYSSADKTLENAAGFLKWCPPLYNFYINHNAFVICMLAGLGIWLISYFSTNRYNKK